MESRPDSAVQPRARTVAYLAGAFPKRSETFVYREVRALRQRGWNILCATLHESDSPPESSEDLEAGLTIVYEGLTTRSVFAELLSFPRRSLSTLAQASVDALAPGETMKLGERAKLFFQAGISLGLAHRLRPSGVEHIHAHFAHAPTTVAMYTAHQLEVPFSFTGHANDIFQRRALLKKKLSRARFTSCISQWHREFYAEQAPKSTSRFHVVRCGVDTDEWLPIVQSDASTSPLRLVTLCRLVEKKGIDILVRALALMKQEATLVVCGDGPEFERLQALAKELSCDSKITWLGAVENDAARKALREAEVYCMPCRTDANGDRDGIPVAHMEAMACGLVVVSGDLPAIRELVSHQETGVLLPDLKPQTLALELDRLARCSRQELASKGRKRVEEEFSLVENVNRLIKLFSASTPGAKGR